MYICIIHFTKKVTLALYELKKDVELIVDNLLTYPLSCISQYRIPSKPYDRRPRSGSDNLATYLVSLTSAKWTILSLKPYPEWFYCNEYVTLGFKHQTTYLGSLETSPIMFLFINYFSTTTLVGQAIIYYQN